MLRAILWKEWRQQRSFLFAILILAMVLIGAFAGIVGLQAERRISTFDKLAMATLWMAVIQAMVTGSMLFAGEVESGTLDFLDRCSADRRRVWFAKIASALALTSPFLAIPLFFGGLTAVPVLVIAVEILLLSAACSIFARTTIRAVGMIACLLAFGVYAVGFMSAPVAVALNFAVVGVMVYASRRRFCGYHRRRLPGIMETLPLRLPASWVTGSLWLTVRRQWGAAFVIGAAIVAFVCWMTMTKQGNEAFIAAPLVAFAVGCVAGWSVFGLEQSDAERFLGDQRFPRNRLWLAKIGCWLAATALATGVIASFVSLFCRERFGSGDVVAQVAAQAVGRVVLFALLGFSAGQFFGIHDRRLPVTIVLTLAIAAPIGAAWYAPMFFGAPVWPFAVVPILFLAASRFELRRWAAGRLEGVARWVRCAIVVFAAFGWTGLLLWQRTAEVPDVGQPVVAANPVESPEEQERDQRIRATAEGALQQFNRLFRDANTLNVLPLDFSRWHEPGIELGPDPSMKLAGWDLFDQVVALGPPDEGRAEFVRRLAEAFEGDWAGKLRHEMANHPHPLLVLSDSDEREKTAIAIGVPARLLCMRSLLRVAEGQTEAGLEDLALALAIMRRCISFQRPVSSYEWYARQTAETMLRQSGSDAAFCRRLLDVLNRHAERRPSISAELKASYSSANRGNQFTGPIAAALLDAPLESIRSNRLRRAYFEGFRTAADRSALILLPKNRKDIRLWTAKYLALATPDRSVEDWAQIMSRESLFFDSWGPIQIWQIQMEAMSLAHLNAIRLACAAALFRHDHGRDFVSLDELAPEYFPTLPSTSIAECAFVHRKSTGETWKLFPDEPELLCERAIAPGSDVIDVPCFCRG